MSSSKSGKAVVTPSSPPSVPVPPSAVFTVHRIATGDTDAFAELYDRYIEQVYAAALSVSKSRDEAEDVAEEAFWNVWVEAPEQSAAWVASSPDRKDADGAVETWVTGLIRARTESHTALSSDPINKGRSAGIRSRLLWRVMPESDERRAHAASIPASSILELGGTSSVAPQDASQGGLQDSPQAQQSTASRVEGSSVVSSGSERGGAPTTSTVSTSGVSASGVPAASTTRARSSRRPPVREGFSWGALIVASLVGAVVVAGIQEWRIHQIASKPPEPILQIPADSVTERIHALEAEKSDLDSLVSMLVSPSMITVDLLNRSATGPLARMYWDPTRHEWLLYTYNVRAPQPGKIFQVWLHATTNAAPISLGTIVPTNDGRTPVLRVTYALDPRAFQRIAVSEEPISGSAEPTGPVVIAGMRR